MLLFPAAKFYRNGSESELFMVKCNQDATKRPISMVKLYRITMASGFSPVKSDQGERESYCRIVRKNQTTGEVSVSLAKVD